jgi:hypothetical protein
MPILPSRKVVRREFVTIRKQTRRGRFFEVGRCIITFECGHKREYGTSDAPSKYGRCVECGKWLMEKLSGSDQDLRISESYFV